VLERVTIRGSIVGTRQDLPQAFGFAAEGKVKAHIRRAALEDLSSVFRQALKVGAVEGRMMPRACGWMQRVESTGFAGVRRQAAGWA
jgi:D-arabinose 1-dehydrogenase-like Zn-dependent alcohol dehydrogenase